ASPSKTSCTGWIPRWRRLRDSGRHPLVPLRPGTVDNRADARRRGRKQVAAAATPPAETRRLGRAAATGRRGPGVVRPPAMVRATGPGAEDAPASADREGAAES